MERAQAFHRLKQHEQELRRLGVQSLYMFGSTARDEARPDSDVDLFFDHDIGTFSLFDLFDVKEATARILQADADIMTRNSIHPALRTSIENSALVVF